MYEDEVVNLVSRLMEAANLSEVEIDFTLAADVKRLEIASDRAGHRRYRLKPRTYRVTVELTEEQYLNCVDIRSNNPHLYIGGELGGIIRPGTKLPIVDDPDDDN